MSALVNQTRRRVLAAEARVAASPVSQLVGWMFRSVPENTALGLPRCPIVHTFGMRAPLDIVFCDSGGRVLRVIADLRPFRVSPLVANAAMTWEARAGTLAPWTHPGDILVWEGD